MRGTPSATSSRKFDTLRLFYRSPEVIRRITREAVEDAAKDNIRYLELRFTPVALSRAERFPLHEVMDWVIESSQAAAREFGLMVRLIPSVNRHENPELAEQVAWLAAERMDHGVVGLDLAGNEAEFSSEPFYGMFREARQAGLHIAIHAGEWGPAANVKEAIEELGAERIAHGVRIVEDDSVTRACPGPRHALRGLRDQQLSVRRGARAWGAPLASNARSWSQRDGQHR